MFCLCLHPSAYLKDRVLFFPCKEHTCRSRDVWGWIKGVPRVSWFSCMSLIWLEWTNKESCWNKLNFLPSYNVKRIPKINSFVLGPSLRCNLDHCASVWFKSCCQVITEYNDFWCNKLFIEKELCSTACPLPPTCLNKHEVGQVFRFSDLLEGQESS